MRTPEEMVEDYNREAQRLHTGSMVDELVEHIRKRDGEVLRDAADTLAAMARASTTEHRQDGWRAAAQVLADLAEHHEGVTDE